MNALQVMAMESAKTGDWQLADAMELIARNANEPWIVAGVCVNGRMRGLVVNTDVLSEFDIVGDDQPDIIDLNGGASYLKGGGDFDIEFAENVVGNAAKVIALEGLRNAH